MVAGPTASGKTSFAIKLAQELDGELINADSRQVYRYMDIGTNKGNIKKIESPVSMQLQSKAFELFPFKMESTDVVGWLFDIVDPDEEFNLYAYYLVAMEMLDNIISRGKQPILVGGTGLYIDAILKGYNMQDVEGDKELRQQLETLTLEQLQTQLRTLDADSIGKLNNSDLNNPVRLIRLIEKLKQNGSADMQTSAGLVEYKMYYPKFDRAELYQEIDNRVEEMFDQGLVLEVEKLIALGYKDTKPMKGIGYKEVVGFLEGRLSMEACKRLIKQGHRNYARRQVTWFEGPSRGYDRELFSKF